MNNLINVLQIILAVLLTGLILVQSRGTGLGRAWGGGGNSGSSFTRRGLEKLIFKATFVVSALFIILSLLQVVVL